MSNFVECPHCHKRVTDYAGIGSVKWRILSGHLSSCQKYRDKKNLLNQNLSTISTYRESIRIVPDEIVDPVTFLNLRNRHSGVEPSEEDIGIFNEDIEDEVIEKYGDRFQERNIAEPICDYLLFQLNLISKYETEENLGWVRNLNGTTGRPSWDDYVVLNEFIVSLYLRFELYS
jgi:hypothetical protein